MTHIYTHRYYSATRPLVAGKGMYVYSKCGMSHLTVFREVLCGFLSDDIPRKEEVSSHCWPEMKVNTLVMCDLIKRCFHSRQFVLFISSLNVCGVWWCLCIRHSHLSALHWRPLLSVLKTNTHQVSTGHRTLSQRRNSS